MLHLDSCSNIRVVILFGLLRSISWNLFSSRVETKRSQPRWFNVENLVVDPIPSQIMNQNFYDLAFHSVYFNYMTHAPYVFSIPHIKFLALYQEIWIYSSFCVPLFTIFQPLVKKLFFLYILNSIKVTKLNTKYRLIRVFTDKQIDI